MVTPGPRILVKAHALPAQVRMALGANKLRLGATPLFTSIGEAAPGLGIAAGPRWFVVEADPLAISGENAWDLCHSLVADGLGLAGGIEAAEPDLQQAWLVERSSEQALAMAAPCGAPETQNDEFPEGPHDAWHLDQGFSELQAAAAALGNVPAARRVRIAHLDTGYDPNHATKPQGLERSLERNFVEADRPQDATDVTDGPFTNLGHGTGTLGILAGGGVNSLAPIGGAPFAAIVPIRVANSVVLFYNSAIARALDYVHALCQAPATAVDVVTMSMGGLPSLAWADAVNALYDVGVFIVTAAGNNFGNLPTRNIVYPARFGRVVAACGVMADHSAYADLGLDRMAGNYGPTGKMRTAMAAFTPNTPWARLGCPRIIDQNGAGTSSATPQIAAAAAIWIQKNRTALRRYPEPWMRVEAVRKAMFDTCTLLGTGDRERLGHGELRANAALGQAPAAAGTLRKEAEDSATFPFLRTLTGLGAAPMDSRGRMVELEALQLAQSAEVQALLPDPEVPPDSITSALRQQIAEALVAQPGVSKALRSALGATRPTQVATSAPKVEPLSSLRKLHLELATRPPLSPPARRRLKVYAYDPSLGNRLETLGINEAVLDVRWEQDLEPGPVGEYVEVVDVDPASGCCYAPVDLNHPHLLTSDGLTPSEANPQFHQQMTYAVAMRTIERFEAALGRRALWAPRLLRLTDGTFREEYVQRLRIYPHALRAANAYYSPDKRALLFGYFKAGGASDRGAGDVLPGGVVFTAVSHDIIAHETTHALLDGLHRRFREPTNPDVLAFHEAFADIVALFQHFSIPEALRDQIARTRGDLGQESLLAKLAVQFGQATRRYGALRDAIGRIEKGQWKPSEPKGDEYTSATEAHDRGAVLVASVFDAFLKIYRQRSADLVRLATNGTGVLPEGNIPEVLADRLAREAGKVAGQVLAICIRALDYCPPVDITFGEYLRALVTADRDVVPDDRRTYRVAFISAFRDRGIYPSNVRHLSADSLAWEPPPLPLGRIGDVLAMLSLTWDMSADRRAAYHSSRSNAARVKAWLMDPAMVPDDELATLGLVRQAQDMTIGGLAGTLGGIEVHSVRPARRIGPDGVARADLVIEVTQTFRMPGRPPLRGGVTLLVDLERGQARYLVLKRVLRPEWLQGQLDFAMSAASPMWGSYFDPLNANAEPFALLHRHG
ncbi:peptidase S8 and S53 subtilisin kexin sedolisin (plasmid) [Methylorubrum extorquens CM4]|uniref:Peptidase S8 and S53 subtilisin kexin sedolisin n=2 Tax=Methylorubrum extorquens TaxID=408 RepID=B7L3H9_METC4|nr:peptidase S8 and S53 subtilisin kexin sedolisin [Methylorubrum extorquens CM4]